MKTLVSIALVALIALPAAADWTLAEHADSVLMYDSLRLSEFAQEGNRLKSSGRGYLLPAVTVGEDGVLIPYNEGMSVNGEFRQGQMLLTPDNSMAHSWAEFVLHGCSEVSLQYGMCDGSKAEGTKLAFSFYRADAPQGEPVAETTIRLTEREWKSETVNLPGGDLFARVKVEFVGHAGWNWTALVCSGNGEIGTREEARALSPLADRLQEMPTELQPDDVHVSAREGFDILFLGDEPYINYAAKGHVTGSHELQKQAGINLFYSEGALYEWEEGADQPNIPPDSHTFLNMYMCQRENLPYKTAVGMAHCVYYLPEWLVKRENLGMEEHFIRHEDPRHTSFIKPKTLEWSKRALNGFAEFFAPHTAIFVLGQEDQIDQWDCQSDEAKAAFREWLSDRFNGDFAAFAEYVGGVRGCSAFEDAPYLDHFASHEAYGYPRRAAYLKYLWQVQAYTDYLIELKEHCRTVAPDVPVTQRYVVSPAGIAISEMADFDYDYMYGHMSAEGTDGRYGSGRKIWNGIYGFCGLLPTPRGGSIGLCLDREIRRTGMTEEQWETNAWTLLANGCTGYEMQPFFPRWGEAWDGAAMVDEEKTLNEQGRLSAQVMGKVTGVADYCEHYDRYEDVAVFHDSAWQSGSGLGVSWSQSKMGIYTMIREMGYHPDPVTLWEMTPENLANKKILVLAGSVPIAPEAQEAIREYVRNGGTLLALYSAAGQGFPGANSWEFTGENAQAAAEMSFNDPPAVAHLGDVLGIESGGGSARRGSFAYEGTTVDLSEFNVLVDEGRWVDEEAACATLVPREGATVAATFDDGTPAVIVNSFGSGGAITLGFDAGLLANNLWDDGLYGMLDQVLAQTGCRKTYETGSYQVEAGMWHNDAGERLLVLVNHDFDRAHTVKLPDGTEVTIDPWRAAVWTSDKGVL